ncbi:hypothetical protein CCR95_20785 [Thiocystis minor]|uniref:addiction module protein n=1 Tax=Thiocystis minor TaxID=61597 RepID=UPI001911B097|nr:addiction module protein [Thiocystis minor]MBK5966443.1 hypothetical protein [Thiocystis minor]
MIFSQLESTALTLLLEQRAALAQKLLLSLEELNDAEFDRRWGEASARRADACDACLVQTIPGEAVASKARALLK